MTERADQTKPVPAGRRRMLCAEVELVCRLIVVALAKSHVHYCCLRIILLLLTSRVKNERRGKNDNVFFSPVSLQMQI